MLMKLKTCSFLIDAFQLMASHAKVVIEGEN